MDAATDIAEAQDELDALEAEYRKIAARLREIDHSEVPTLTAADEEGRLREQVDDIRERFVQTHTRLTKAKSAVEDDQKEHAEARLADAGERMRDAAAEAEELVDGLVGALRVVLDAGTERHAATLALRGRAPASLFGKTQVEKWLRWRLGVLGLDFGFVDRQFRKPLPGLLLGDEADSHDGSEV